MGKKHNKFKKHGSAKHNVVRSQTVQPVGAGMSSTSSTIQGQPSAPTEIITEKPDEMAILNEKYAFVRRDVRKLMIVLGSLVILFIAIYFLNTKTEILINLGNWVYKTAHFSI